MSDSSKRTEVSDHKEVLTFTLRSDEEHVRAVTKHAVNNMVSSFEQPIYWTACKSGSAQFAPREYKCWRGKAGEICRTHQLEVKIEMVSERPQGTTTTIALNWNATAVMMTGQANLVHLTHQRWRTSSNF